MSKATWRAIKEDNSFYVRLFRRGTRGLLYSLFLNLLLLIFIAFVFLQEGEPEFYATDGIRSPILLKPLNAPNRTSTYLLPPDPISEDENGKLVPE